MIELAYLALLLVISIALGRRILKYIGIGFNSSLEGMVFSLPLGLSAIAYAMLFAGLLGYLYKSVLVIILALLYIALWKDVGELLRIIFSSIRNFSFNKFVRKHDIALNFYSIVIILLLLFPLMNFFLSFSPPWHFDVIAYHLAMGKIYIAAHKVVYIPYMLFSNFPSLIDTMYMVGLLLSNGILANLLGYSLGIAFLASIYKFCQRFFNERIALLSSLIFYSFPLIFMLSRTSHIDVQLAFFVFLSVYAICVYSKSKDSKWLFLSAIFSGLGISSKVFGAVAAAVIFALLVLILIRDVSKKRMDYKSAFAKSAAFCIIAFVIVMPWLLKSYFFTGNPVWPELNEIFHGKYWDEKHQQGINVMHNLRKPSLCNYLRLPWDIVTQQGKRLGNIDEDLEIGPFVLAILPLYFFVGKKDRVINSFFMLLFVYLTVWFFLSHIFRYVIYAVPLIAIISGYVIHELLKINLLSRALKLLLLFTFGFNLLFFIGANAKEFPAALGLESEDNFHSKYPGPIYDASKFANSNLPESAKILLFRDTRGYFIDRGYVWADPLTQAYIDYSNIKSEDDYYKELKRLGITHILVNNNFGWRNPLHDVITSDYRYTPEILEMKDRFLEKYTRNLYNNGDILVNELK
ncbi:glycosyltransferase family 39 protein [Candidatus Woesearchaeota archaeon]|nr:glycosyltransferase family 39 protein [Candidatus Woesearchaeota archaeon]